MRSMHKMAMEKQKKYCAEKDLPFFAPLSGVCWSCGRTIVDKDNEHITSCDKCNRTYCD